MTSIFLRNWLGSNGNEIFPGEIITYGNYNYAIEEEKSEKIN